MTEQWDHQVSEVNVINMCSQARNLKDLIQLESKEELSGKIKSYSLHLIDAFLYYNKPFRKNYDNLMHKSRGNG